jgi:hypothetical protein
VVGTVLGHVVVVVGTKKTVENASTVWPELASKERV